MLLRAFIWVVYKIQANEKENNKNKGLEQNDCWVKIAKNEQIEKTKLWKPPVFLNCLKYAQFANCNNLFPISPLNENHAYFNSLVFATIQQKNHRLLFNIASLSQFFVDFYFAFSSSAKHIFNDFSLFLNDFINNKYTQNFMVQINKFPTFYLVQLC